VGRTDGYIFAVITVGRGLMPMYGDNIPAPDRWHIVNYVRSLQRQAGQTAPPANPAAAGSPTGTTVPGTISRPPATATTATTTGQP
jgi:hypothetical protein